jgi:hypothetical protein
MPAGTVYSAKSKGFRPQRGARASGPASEAGAAPALHVGAASSKVRAMLQETLRHLQKEETI